MPCLLRRKILEAALSLFAENGYDGTSVEQIAGIAGIKAPSLYKHYKGKKDILNALIDSAETWYEEVFGSERNGSLMMPVSVRLNHAIADGFHVANVYRLMEKEIAAFCKR